MLLRLLSGSAVAIGVLLHPRPAPAQQPDSVPPRWRIPASQLGPPQPATGEVMGYPAVSADQRVVVMMLRNRDFTGLDRYLTELQDATKRRIQLEYDLVDATLAFYTADSTLEPLLNQWIASAPASAHARTARADWYLAKAWQARGQEYASKTSAGAFREMGRYVGLAIEEGQAALRLDSTGMIGYSVLIDALLLAGDREQSRAVLDAGRKHYPGSYYLPHLHLVRLEPRWGGSYQEMDAFAAEIAADSLRNPRLVTLLGAVEADRSDLVMHDDPASALRHANAALRHGPEPYYLMLRGHAFVHLGELARGITDLNAALAWRPQYIDAMELRAEALDNAAATAAGSERAIDLKQLIKDFELILSLDPGNPYAGEQIKTARYELKTCPESMPECGHSEAGPVRVVAAVWRDFGRYLAYLGVLAFVSSWGFFKWVRSGFWLPRYIHLLAFLALLTVCYADYLWVQTGAPMTLRRWIVIPFFPGVVYFLFIGLGGASWASRR